MMALLEKLCLTLGMAQQATFYGGNNGSVRTGLNIREKHASVSTFSTFARVKG